MRATLLFGVGFALLSLTACAHRYDFPVNRLDGAEVRGKPGPARLEALGLHGSNELQGDSNGYSLNPSILSDFAGFAVGLGEKWDLGARFHLNGPLLFRIRYQMAGEPEVRAKKGNFAASIGASVGGSISSAYDVSSGQNNKATYLVFDGGVTLGYRVWDDFQVILGGFYGMTSYDVPSLSGSITQPGWLWGVRWEKEALFLTFEVARSFASSAGMGSGGYFPALAVGLSL